MSSYRIRSIFNSRIHILELLSMEGFHVKNYEGFSSKEIDTMFSHDQLDMLVSKSSSSSEQKEEEKEKDHAGEKKIYVKYYLGKPMRKEVLSNIVEDLFETPQSETNHPLLEPTSDTLVIIIDEEPNDTNVKQLQTLYDRDGIFVMMYNIRRLQFNVRKHVLNPEVSVVGDTEAGELKEKFNIRDWSQLPEISRFDPLAMSIFLRPGQIMRIQRDSPTSIENVYFRYCI